MSPIMAWQVSCALSETVRLVVETDEMMIRRHRRRLGGAVNRSRSLFVNRTKAERQIVPFCALSDDIL